MSKQSEMQRVIRAYKDETGEREVDMHKVAKWATRKGWPLPTPQNPLDLLAKQFSDAARVEIRYDKITGNPYRANHSIVTKHGLRGWVQRKIGAPDIPTCFRYFLSSSRGEWGQDRTRALCRLNEATPQRVGSILVARTTTGQRSTHAAT